MEVLQEEGTAAVQETNSPNEITETIVGVANVNSPSGDAAAAEEAETAQFFLVNTVCSKFLHFIN